MKLSWKTHFHITMKSFFARRNDVTQNVWTPLFVIKHKTFLWLWAMLNLFQHVLWFDLLLNLFMLVFMLICLLYYWYHLERVLCTGAITEWSRQKTHDSEWWMDVSPPLLSISFYVDPCLEFLYITLCNSTSFGRNLFALSFCRRVTICCSSYV